MFMRYTHYGIGHPVFQREMTKNCSGAGQANSLDLEEDEDGSNEDWEGRSEAASDHDGNENEEADEEYDEGYYDEEEHDGEEEEEGDDHSVSF